MPCCRCDQYFKDTIWKQFTTWLRSPTMTMALWPIFQRYNLKAIHNFEFSGSSLLHAVTNISKIQSESNSQRKMETLSLWNAVTNISKIQSESNSQRRRPGGFQQHRCDQYFKDTIWKQFTTRSRMWPPMSKLWPIFQRYNLKAIHNAKKVYDMLNRAVTNISKIQSESNSQRQGVWCDSGRRCDQYFKDTIWKQFTTKEEYIRWGGELWPIFQRYNLKAIHNRSWSRPGPGTLWPIFQRYNLKAIHNFFSSSVNSGIAVTNISKIQSESNSQLRIKP